MIEETSEVQESFGDYLKRHREAAGKTIKDISETTRVPRRFLSAFEENNYEVLPAPTFTRGFLKLYAREIGLETDEVVVRYESFQRSLKLADESAKQAELKAATEANNIAEESQFSQAEEAEAEVSVEDTATEEGASTEETEAQPDSITIGASTRAISPRLIVLGICFVVMIAFVLSMIWKKQSSNIEEAPVAASTETSTQLGAQAGGTEVVPPVKPSVLQITANKPSEISVRLDDNSAQTIMMKAGEVQVLSVYREVEIKSTDKGAFSFQYNSKPLEISGPVIKLFNRHLFDQ
jgi:transcriptional regulator with XRE-family HTH domain